MKRALCLLAALVLTLLLSVSAYGEEPAVPESVVSRGPEEEFAPEILQEETLSEEISPEGITEEAEEAEEAEIGAEDPCEDANEEPDQTAPEDETIIEPEDELPREETPFIRFTEHQVKIYMEDLHDGVVHDPAEAFPYTAIVPDGDEIVWSVSGSAAGFRDYDREIGREVTYLTDPEDIITVFQVFSAGTVELTASLRNVPSVSDTVRISFIAVPEQIIADGGTEQEIFSCETLSLSVTVPGESEPVPDRLSFRVVLSEGEEPAAAVSETGVVTPLLTDDGLLVNGEGIASVSILIDYRGAETVVRVTILQAASDLRGDRVMIPKGEGRSVLLSADDLFTVIPDCSMDRVIAMRSADESVLTIDENGRAKGIKDGETFLICTMSSGRIFRMPAVVLTPAESLEITVPDITFCAGRTAEFGLDAQPWDEKETFLWWTSDEQIATAAGNCLTFRSPGSVRVYAQSVVTGLTASTVIEVIRAVDRIAMFSGYAQVDQFVLGEGQVAELHLKVLPEDATDPGYEIICSDSSVAEVIGGTLFAKTQGTTEIMIRSNDGEAESSFSVVVVRSGKGATGVKLSKKSVTLKEFGTATLKATVNKEAYSKKVYWGTDDPEIVTVTANGKVTAGKPGTARVWCVASSGVFASCTVKVNILYPSSVKTVPAKLTLDPDPLNGTQLSYRILPAQVRQEGALKVTWTTSNPKVAMVGPTDGIVYPIAPGSCKITCKTVNGKKGSCKVTVRKIRLTEILIENPYGALFAGGTYQLSAKTRPENAWNSSVKWSLADSASKKLASINTSTGVLTAKKVGTVRVKAAAQDGSGKNAVISLSIRAPEIISPLFVQADGIEVIREEEMVLEYGDRLLLTTAVEPKLHVDWKSSNTKAAVVRGDTLYAVGSGTAVITAVAGGMHDIPECVFRFSVRIASKSGVSYRTLVIGQYGTSGKVGYLPFLKNSIGQYIDAMDRSVIDGIRYKSTYAINMSSVSSVQRAINTVFEDADDDDVSVFFFISHGAFMKDDGTFGWYLNGNGKTAVYMRASDILSALQQVRGHVVFIVLSCYSGGSDSDPKNLTGMIKSLDTAAHNGKTWNGSPVRGKSYSVICSSDGVLHASYADTSSSWSYDFFTCGLLRSIGWDMTRKQAADPAGDMDENGRITLEELAESTRVLAELSCSEYLEKYGRNGYWGSAEGVQKVSFFLSPRAKQLTVFAPGIWPE